MCTFRFRAPSLTPGEGANDFYWNPCYNTKLTSEPCIGLAQVCMYLYYITYSAAVHLIHGLLIQKFC